MSAPSTQRPRRRVRIAHAALNRVRAQRESFATAYAPARTAQDRFNTAATALRAAAAERTQRDNPATAKRLDEITNQITALVDELHDQQERHAQRVLCTDERRQARNERRGRREHCDEQSTV